MRLIGCLALVLLFGCGSERPSIAGKWTYKDAKGQMATFIFKADGSMTQDTVLADKSTVHGVGNYIFDGLQFSGVISSTTTKKPDGKETQNSVHQTVNAGAIREGDVLTMIPPGDAKGEHKVVLRRVP